jgi:hypothetical protein
MCIVWPGNTRVIVVSKLRWCYYLSADAKKDDTVIKLKKYDSAYLEFLGKKSYWVEDSVGKASSVIIKSVDTSTGVLTLVTSVGLDLLVSDGAALIFPLAGLSGDPTLISESSISSKTELLNIIAHELGHTDAGLLDVEETGNIMFGIAQSSSPPLQLRCRPIKKYYSNNLEEQWRIIKR